ncbi:exported hypothetical protein [Photobacterium kishitanii]|nr:exported hypothetical protein [Photobacterium kishitanii]
MIRQQLSAVIKMKKILFFISIIFSHYGNAATSLNEIITLNANISNPDEILPGEIKSEILGDKFQILSYNNKTTSFDPIIFSIRSTANRKIDAYSFNVIYKNMNCSQNNTIVNVPLSLSVNDVAEDNNKITLSGSKYWYKVTTGNTSSAYNQYISDTFLKIRFGYVTNSASSDLACYGNITILTSVDL